MKNTLIFVLALLASPGLAQQEPVRALQAASAEIGAATTALAQAEMAEDQAAALSDAIGGLEAGLGSLRLALRASLIVEADKRVAMAQNRDELGRLLATMVAIQNTPAPLALLHPDGALASARAGITLSAITPGLREQAAQLRAELDSIATLNVLHSTALGNLQTALQSLQQARAELTIALQQEQPVPSLPAETLEILASLARASDDLGGLAAQLSQQIPSGSLLVGSAFIAQRGQLPLPVNGTIIRHFNGLNAAGIRQPGIVLLAPPLSLVLAPQGGVVRFAGDFLEYGQVVILEPAPDHLQIYAGFGQVYVSTGEVLESGAPMGLLGGEMPDSAEFLAESTGENDNTAESLYIEIRENGMPVDPAMWFAAN